MKAEAMSLTFLGNEGHVKIPFFQRGYVWNRDNWDDTLSDLRDFEKSHFLGSLILKQLEKSILLMEFNQDYLRKFLSEGTLTKKDLLDYYSGEEIKDKYKLIEKEINEI